MVPKGEDGSWLRNAAEERKGLDSLSMRIKPSDDGELEYSGSCFPRGRKAYSDTAGLKGAPFARLDAHQQDAEGVKARSVLGALSCCCGQSGGGGSKGSSQWEDDDLSGGDGCGKAPTTYWKQLARRAKAHVHVRQAAPHPLNYDPHSYQMNFDDGGRRREDRASSFLLDENDDPATRERAMHSALLKKFAASRAQQVAA